MFKWLDKIPMHLVALSAVLLGMAPFFSEPHLWEKLKMLAAGALQRPIDIFDLLMHGVPLILLAIKLIRGERKVS
ncbi:MAG: RND transporter [Candidatus Thiodiazotropha sp. (ex Lucinoma aequizonata)]|nr:RND transporter [Candidatus Thiodiazotropha sp. (ex Lucinoma aequizonata)]MCU7902288.1 RND transporter [Candidatus Thiodiazotropha sp. (ex Lucinoma aequizonata)]